MADIQQHLLGRLTKAATAGPARRAVPAVLDEVFLRVPAERKWDLLDLLYRLSREATSSSTSATMPSWPRGPEQRRRGHVILLEPEPEPV